jgi:hypothetical protein
MRYVAMGRFFVFLMIFPVLGAYYVYNLMNHAINYKKVEARVNSFDVECKYYKVERGAITKRTTKTDWESCGQIEREFANDRANISYRTKVSVSYISPADNIQHEGDVTIMGEQEGLTTGGRWEVLAHTSNPEEIDPV